jgi:hypothetical protein
MQRLRRWAGSGLTVALLIASSGCGRNPEPGVGSSTTGEVRLTGTVKIHGLVMSGGKITFDPSNDSRKQATPRTAEVRSDGTFEVTTLTGPNSVRISGPAVKKEPAFGGAKTVDVKPGENTIEISYPD